MPLTNPDCQQDGETTFFQILTQDLFDFFPQQMVRVLRAVAAWFRCAAASGAAAAINVAFAMQRARSLNVVVRFVLPLPRFRRWRARSSRRSSRRSGRRRRWRSLRSACRSSASSPCRTGSVSQRDPPLLRFARSVLPA